MYGQLSSGTIRLLRLCEDAANECVGNLETVALDAAPPYYTLSYCWGQDLQNIPLTLNDGTILVSPNLSAAINRLKRLAFDDIDETFRMRYIWIDKICINQDNLLERSAQVGLMGRIYSQSVRTLIWLGFDIGECCNAWHLVDEIYNVCMRQAPEVKSMVDIPLKLYSEKHHIESGLPDFSHQRWMALSALLTDPWFSRIWVIQEVVLSREDPIILHGQHLHLWNRLGWAASWMRRNGFFRLPHFPEALRNIDEMSNIRRSQGKWSLDALLTATSVKFHASDQRDKVYGLLGIAAEACDSTGDRPTPLQPDYTLSVEQVYLRTARYLLQTKRSLALLIRTRFSSPQTIQSQHVHDLAQLPTWVPDWSDFRLFDRDIMKSMSWLSYSPTLEPATLGFPKHCMAAAEHPMAITPSADETALRLTGIKLDMVLYNFPFNSPTQSNKDFIKEFASKSLSILTCVAPMLAERGVVAWTSEYIRTTTAEQYHLGGRKPEQLLKDGSAFILELLSKCDPKYSSHILRSDELAANSILECLSFGGCATSYAALAQNFCYGRSLVVTAHQRLGLAAASTRPGDFVSVLHGGGVPYVLRRDGCGWEFIGDSYFPDLIQGEAVNQKRVGRSQEEVFHIH